MNLRSSLIALCAVLVLFTPHRLRASDADPALGKWKFPKAVFIFTADGTLTNAKGKHTGSWICVDQGSERKYVMTIADGKFVNTVILKEGGAALEGTNNHNVPILAHRMDLPVADGGSNPTPKPAPPTPTPAPAAAVIAQIPTPPPAHPSNPAPTTADGDPVVGKWKFPSGKRILNADGTCSDEQGNVTPGASWKCVSTAGDPKYVIAGPGGKGVETMLLKMNGAVLEGINKPTARVVALRQHDGTPDNQRLFVQSHSTPAATPVIDLSRPAIKWITVDRETYNVVRPQSIHGDTLTFAYQAFNKAVQKRDVRLSMMAYKDLVAIEEYNSALSSEPAFKSAKAAFCPKISLKDGKTYTGVKVTSKIEGKLALMTDSGYASCVADQVEAADLNALLATQTRAILKANAEKETAIAESRRQKIALGNYLDDRAMDVPNGGLPLEYVRLMRRIGDPWTRNPAKALQMPEHPALQEWLRGFASLDRGGNPALSGVIQILQERVAGIYSADRERKAYLAQQSADLADLSARQQSGAFRTYAVSGPRKGQVVDDGSSVVDHAFISGLFVQAGSYLADAMIGTSDERADRERNESLLALMSKLGEIYPPSPAKKGLLAVRLNRSGIEIINQSGAPLTNLTVDLELEHFTTAPHAREFRAIFLSKLDSGAAVHLNPNDVRNLWYRDWKNAEYRPEIAGVWQGFDEQWLWGTGGTVSAHMNIYALEAYETENVTLAENSAAAARFEIKNIIKTLGDGKDKDRDWALERAKHVLGMLPPGSPFAAEVREILANPSAAAEKGRAIIAETISQGLIGTYTGTFNLDSSFLFAPRNKEIADHIKAINGRGDFVLEITEVSAERQVKAKLYSVGHPEQKRVFQGTAPALELLKTAFRMGPVSGDPPPGPDSAPFTETVTGLILDIKGRKLGGQAVTKVGKDFIRFDIVAERAASGR